MVITHEEKSDFICANCKNLAPPLVEILLLNDQDLLTDNLQKDEEEQTINIDFGLENFKPDLKYCGLNAPENIAQEVNFTGMPDFPDFPDINDEDFLLVDELLENFDFIFDLD